MLIFIAILRSTTIVLQILLSIFLRSDETECATLTGQQNIVFPKLLDSRSVNGAKVLQINQDLTLNLEKSTVLSKNFLLRTYEDNIMKHTYRDGEVLEEGLYHDARTFSSLMLSEDNGLQVEGVLGPKLRIKPLMGERKVAEGSVAHILYEVTEDKINNGVNDGVRWETSLNVSERDNTRDNTNDVVLVELLVAVDSTFRSQFRSVTTLLRYLTITMNSANLRYTTVKNPSVKIKLHALEILTEYMETFLYRVDHYVAAYRSLESFREYVQQHPSKYSSYDAVYLFTGLDMAKYNGYGWDMQLQGIAYVGGTCTNRKVGIGEDKVGTFVGVRILAHEIGHLLGCPHDGESYGIYSSVNCPWNDGYIMSYKVEDSRSMQFSACCNHMIRLHVRSHQGSCLLKKDTKRSIKKTNFTKGLPGEYLKRDGLCKCAFPEVRETYLMEGEDKSQCRGRCFMPEHVYRVGFRTTIFPDNFPCSANDGRVCINGNCVSKKPRYATYQPSK